MTFRFFLGGQDLEMAEIRKLLETHVPGQVEDLRLAWGARLSSYLTPLMSAIDRGETPVLIELQDDLPAEAFDRDHATVVVDHHGDRAGHDQPTSIEQVFRLLGLPPKNWSRWLSLVAANDRAHVAGLCAIGATRDEIVAVRAADRAAQGVSALDEAEAIRAIAQRKQEGRLTIVETVGNTSSAIADLMLPELGGPGYRRLLVAMPEKLAVFADGDAIEDLARAFPGLYWGGDLPRAGFWGMSLGDSESGPTRDAIERLR